ncbi:MAG TPA: iron-sulfur cluster assembly accessory protein, partial [Geminicoccaceae bacterium]|nr:iron-sulfur cluster assembly accessory protein [Geminicoccaceae bacterium]
MAQQLLSLTPAALARVRALLAAQGESVCGLKLGVKTTGCSGMSYQLDFARAIGPGDEVIEADGVRVVV